MQGVLEETLSTLAREPVALTVAGRTDAGVHADAQVAHADVPATGTALLPDGAVPDGLVRRLARMLPPDVRVHAVTVAPDGLRRPLLGGAPPLRLPRLHGPVRSGAAARPRHACAGPARSTSPR